MAFSDEKTGASEPDGAADTAVRNETASIEDLAARLVDLEARLRAALSEAEMARAERNYVVHDRDILATRLYRARRLIQGLAVCLMIAVIGAGFAVFC
jgi:hypothetical protein